MKYRIIYEYGIYYPQVKSWLPWPRWHSTNEPPCACQSLEEAQEEIRLHKKVFSKEDNQKKVDWESYEGWE